MNTTNIGLSVLLCAQLGLAMYTWTPTKRKNVQPTNLFDFQVEDVAQVTIYGPRGVGQAPTQPTILKRSADQWILPNRLDYPADTDRVLPVLDDLAAIQVTEPIASQEHHFGALHVSDEEYTRRIVFDLKDQRKVEAYLGAGITYRDNIRLADSNDVFSYKVPSVWSIPETDPQYYERDVLAADVTKVPIATIEHAMATVTLIQANGRWKLKDAPEGYRLDERKVFSELTGALTFRMLNPVAAQALPEHGLDTPTARVTWTEETDQGTKRFGYTIGTCDDTHCLGKADGLPWVFDVRMALVGPLIRLKPSSLAVRQMPRLRGKNPLPKAKKSHGMGLEDIGKKKPTAPGGVPH